MPKYKTCPHCDGGGKETYHNSENGDTRQGTCLTCLASGLIVVDPTPTVNCSYGAPMGRGDGMPDQGARLYLQRVPINSGGYDRGGAYWGLGEPLWAYGDGVDWRYIRACNRDAAKVIIRDGEAGPDARFYR